jgi:pyruvate dehydrogenase (quinone)
MTPSWIISPSSPFWDKFRRLPAALRVASVEALQAACQTAFTAERPLLIEAITDPNVPPLPSHLTAKQRAKLQQAFASDDADLPGALHQVERHLERG